VGTAAGRVDRYNMQSGLHRGAYCRWVGVRACVRARVHVCACVCVMGGWREACSDRRCCVCLVLCGFPASCLMCALYMPLPAWQN